MPQVRVRDRNQITLPAAVIKAANIGLNEVLEVSYKDGVITLTTERVMKEKTPSLMALAGCTKGLYGATTVEREQYTANERTSWES